MNSSFLFRSLVFVLTVGLFSSCQLGRFVFYNFADVKDHKKFKSRPLEAPEEAFTFYETDSGRVPKAISGIPFDTYLEQNKTVAFMIIQNDTILYENYFRKYDSTSIVPSFSMAKSVTSILIGCAIDDGFIDSIQEPITKYIPELASKGFDDVTIEHLLQMTSGIDYNESYVNPFGDAAAFYYGLNLRKQIEKMELAYPPGERFKYTSGTTQLLGLVLERSLDGPTITSYLQEKIWTPLGMEHDASWSIDRKKDGLEKTFCCLNATARDFAKLGRLYLNEGDWNGQRIISADWVAQSTKVDTSMGSRDYYQYQWWMPTPGVDFMAEGILGQFVYVHPEKNLIIVRLGRKYGDTYWDAVFTGIADVY
ncbi:serine hydrolase [Cryomorphaceae bacterium]|nr:serine hydrolase [Cryomorphaceae bacterium]